jgi:glutamyl-tRNA synthetase
VIEAIPEEEYTFTRIHDDIMRLPEALAMKNGQVLWPMRVALSGKETTPGGAFELADILGKEESLKRLNFSLNRL